MKHLLFLLIFHIACAGYAQNLSIKDGAIISDKPLIDLPTPCTLNFDAGFNGKAFEVWKNDGSKALASGTFGTDGTSILFDGNNVKFGTKSNIANGVRNFILKIGSCCETGLSLKKDSKQPQKDETVTLEYGLIYYDAMILVSDDERKDFKEKIIKSYKSKAGTTKNQYIEKVEEKIKNDPENQSDSPFQTNLLSTLGNTDVTAVATGVARFIVKRMKEELNAAFFDKMKGEMGKYPELGVLFPKTSGLLQHITDYSYASILQMLKEAFETDMATLPANLYNLKTLSVTNCTSGNTQNCKDRITTINSFFATKEGKLFSLFLRIIKEAPTAKNPAVFFDNVVESTDFTDLKTTLKTDTKANRNQLNFLASLELANLISQSFTSKNEGEVWINEQEFKELFKKKLASTAYVGLLQATEDKKDKGDQITFYNDNEKDTLTFSSILNNKDKTIKDFEQLIRDIYEVFKATNQAIQKIKKATDNNDESNAEILYVYYTNLSKTLKSITDNQTLKDVIDKDLAKVYEEVEAVLTPAVDIVYHVSTKKYTSAIFDVVSLLEWLSKQDKVKDQKVSTVINAFIKYGTLVANVANAKTSEEVQSALEASALPVGSSAIKKNTAFSITLNSYIGGYYSKVSTTFKDNKNTVNPKQDSSATYKAYGVYAPIGISLNIGLRKCGGISVIGQFADVGALADFYLLNGEQASLPEKFSVRLANVFALGVQVAWNVPRLPISITGGWQRFPSLNQAAQVQNVSNLSPTKAGRFQASIVVDIPLYNIFVKPFKKYKTK